MVRLLVGPTSGTAGLPKFLETGIKVIDVMCPLVAGGTLAIATDIGAGVMVSMEELVRRLSGGCPFAVDLCLDAAAVARTARRA